MKKSLLTITLLLTTSLYASSYNPKAVMCEYDMDKTIELSQELQISMGKEDKERVTALMAVLHDTTQRIKKECTLPKKM